MLHQKNEYQRLDSQFVDKDKDIKDGDIVTIAGQAIKQPSRFDTSKDQTLIKIKTRNGDRYMNLNQKSINILVDEFKSNDDKDWVGKEVKVLLNRSIIGGKKVIIAYLVGKSWELDDYGEPIVPGSQGDVNEEIPVIDVDEEGVNIQDVPF